MFPVALATYLKAKANSVGGGVGLVVFVVVFVVVVVEDPEVDEGFVVVAVDTACPPELCDGWELVEGLVVGVAGAGTTTNLSLLKVVKPAIGMLEIFFKFTTTTGVVTGLVGCVGVVGWVGVVVFLLFPKGLNCDKKFATGVLFVAGTVVGLLREKKPTIAITAMTKMIIKSIKFLFDIKI